MNTLYVLIRNKHYRSERVHFPPIQTEWFGYHLCMRPCGRHPNSPGQAPGDLPPQHTHDDIWNRSHCCRGIMFVTAWNTPCWTPRPRWTQVSKQSAQYWHQLLSVSKSVLHMGVHCWTFYQMEVLVLILRQIFEATQVIFDCKCLKINNWCVAYFFLCRNLEVGPT